MKTFKVGNKQIGADQPPFVIAEMSGNHNQSLDRALAIVDAAAAAGVHAVKIQTYTAETMTLDVGGKGFKIDDPKSLWAGQSLYKLYEMAHTPWKWHKAIFDRCKKKGVLCFSTPFDLSAVDFLESLNAPMYKIASFENVDLPLIRKVASTGKPVIISTGLASVADIADAVDAARRGGCKDLVLLKCTSAYPAEPTSANLLTIPHLREMFGCHVGISDHTMGVGVSIAGVALGACVIEKHFTLARADGGVDSAFSMEPEEMALLVHESEKARQAVGRVFYGPTEKEKGSLDYRRSLYVGKDMKAGDVFTPENLRAIRPGFGLAPKYYASLLGKKINRNAKKGTPLSFELIG